MVNWKHVIEDIRPGTVADRSSDSNQCRLFGDHLFADQTLGRWEILGSDKISRTLAIERQTRAIARDNLCRADLLLLAEWAHAFPNYQGAYSRPDDLRRKSPNCPTSASRECRAAHCCTLISGCARSLRPTPVARCLRGRKRTDAMTFIPSPA
jgi:hypothetical protein